MKLLRYNTGARQSRSQRRGFSLIELLIVIAIILCIAAVAIPNMMNVASAMEVRSAMSQLGGVVQSCRMLAVKDNGTKYVRRKPLVNGRVVWSIKNAGDATTAPTGQQAWLSNQFSELSAPSGGPTQLTGEMLWGSAIDPQTGKDLYFNSRGLPCLMDTGVCTPTNGFIYYFAYTGPTVRWAAVSVSPAGRVKAWYWNGHSWGD